eukprot:534459-Lingulodinium_polyedra.AAC.1
MASSGSICHLSVLAFPLVSGEALESSLGARTCGQRRPFAVLSLTAGFCTRCGARATLDGCP